MRRNMNHQDTKTQSCDRPLRSDRRRPCATASLARRRALCVFVPLWLTFLSGCAEEPPPRLITQIQIEKPEVPPELLACPAIPAPPEGIAMQSDVAAYIIDLFGAGSECRRKLEAVGGLVVGGEPEPQAR